MKKRIKLFSKVLEKLHDGLSITFNRSNIAFGDDFLIFNELHPEVTVTFKRHGDLWWGHFDGDEPMLLEDVPTEFLESILKNID
jgi:hypothetical protein